MLHIRHLSKDFDGVMAVKDLDLNLSPGKITALIGPNGAGKTTLFNLISGFVSPTGGQIFWGEREISYWRSHSIARLGISRTFQEIKLFRTATVMNNLLIGKLRGKYEGVWQTLFKRKEFKNACQSLKVALLKQLQIFSLADKADSPASELSYGQSKLIEILRAAATEPQLLLLDEPVAGLNPRMIATVKTFITELVKTKNMTVLIIEHNMPFVFGFADWVVVMDHGVKIKEGLPEKIINDPEVLEAYLGRSNNAAIH
jgi:branched-chain amino acid transport system ATP-binding protein